MLTLSPAVFTIWFFVLMLLGFSLGYPLAFVMTFLGVFFGVTMLGVSQTVSFLFHNGYMQLLGYNYICVPLFYFMGSMLSESGIASSLYQTIYVLLGKVRGGLALGTIVLGTILAACIGVVTASVALLGLIAVEPMISKGYSKKLATGVVVASGGLGIIIPPSIMLVVYGSLAQLSVGKLMMGAFPAGLLLAVLYFAYVLIYCRVKPEVAPALPPSEASYPWSTKLKMIATSVLPPAILIFAVLGVIFLGVASPTEASAMGALAAVLITVANRKFQIQGDEGRCTERRYGDRFHLCDYVFLTGGYCHLHQTGRC